MIFYGCPKCQPPMASPDSMAGQPETCAYCDNVAIVPQPIRSGPLPVMRRTRRSQYDPQHTGRIIATEMTSKKLKLHTAVSFLAMLITGCGAYLTWDDFNNQWKWLVATLVTTCWYLLTKVRIWWCHG